MMRTTFLLALLAAALSAAAHPSVSVVIDSRGNVYYSDLERVWRIAPNGERRVVVPNVHTHELYVDGQDNLFGEQSWYEGDATKKWGHSVWKRDAAGRITKVIPDREGFLTDYSFVRDRAGNMYWADRERGEIRRRAPNGAISRVAGELKQMYWMHATPAGTLYVVDGSDLVRVKDGRVTRLGRNIASARRHTTMGIWTDRAENVYVAVHGEGVVKRVAQSGHVATVLRSPLPWRPTGGAFAANGDLWLMEINPANAVRVRRVDARQLRPR